MALFEIPVSGWTCFRTADALVNVALSSRVNWAYPCRCKMSRFPFSSFLSSSCHQMGRRQSSCQLPSSRWQVLYRLGPCRQWLASSQLLWEAFLLLWIWRVSENVRIGKFVDEKIKDLMTLDRCLRLLMDGKGKSGRRGRKVEGNLYKNGQAGRWLIATAAL